MTARAWPRAVLLALALFALALGATGCFDPLVGAECAAGHLQCGSLCVDTRSSALHCGGCDRPCLGQCSQGVCLAGDGGAPDGGLLDGEVPDGERPDTEAGPGDAGGGGAGAGGAGGTGGGVGGGGAGGGAPDAGAGGGDAGIPAMCMPGLTPCPGGCFDLQTNPDHCGRCGSSCGSGLCVMGSCVVGGGGHLILIGHDYTVGREGINRLVGNAVFLSPRSPLRVLAYEGRARMASIVGTNRAIMQVAAGRQPWSRTVVTAAGLPAALPMHDVLVIHAQGPASDDELRALGREWAGPLQAFLAQGRVVVLLDGGTDNAGTHQILTEAGLLSVAARAPATGEILTVVLPGDTVATLVPRNYFGEQQTVRYDTAESAVVVRGAMSQAVVIHKVF